MTAEDLREVMAQVRENHERLKRCDGHHFNPVEPGPRGTILANRYQCDRCGGTVSGGSYHWFSVGVAQGKREK